MELNSNTGRMEIADRMDELAELMADAASKRSISFDKHQIAVLTSSLDAWSKEFERLFAYNTRLNVAENKTGLVDSAWIRMLCRCQSRADVMERLVAEGFKAGCGVGHVWACHKNDPNCERVLVITGVGHNW